MPRIPFLVASSQLFFSSGSLHFREGELQRRTNNDFSAVEECE